LKWDHDSKVIISRKSSLTGFCPSVDEPEVEIIDWAEGDEYKVPYGNYKEAILGSLAEQISDRVSILDFKVLPSSTKFNAKFYAPIAHLTNSSGTGKTRSAMELGRLTNVVLVKFSGSNGIPVSQLGVSLKTFMSKNFEKQRYNKCLVCLQVIFQRIIYACDHLCHSEGHVGHIIVDDAIRALLGIEPEQFASSLDELLFSGIKDYLANDCISSDEQAYLGSNLIHIEDTWFPSWRGMSYSALCAHNLKSLNTRKQSIISGLENSDERKAATSLPSLILVLDEAFDLMKDHNQLASLSLTQKRKRVNTDFYRLIRRTLRTSQFWWDHSLTLTISTNAKISQFYPYPSDDPSFRSGGTEAKFLEPIILTNTFDSMCIGPIDSSFECKDNWMNFIFSVNRLKMIACCGRPIWAAHFGRFLNRNYVSGWISPDHFNIFEDTHFIEPISKLARGVKRVKEDSDKFYELPVDEYSMVAVLSLSLGLIKYPSSIDPAELVRVGGMALLSFDGEERKAAGMFCSEGLFNGCATYVLMKDLGAFMKEFKKWIFGSDASLLSIGEIGEILNRILLLKAVFDSERGGYFTQTKQVRNPKEVRFISENILEPVALEDFLDAYCGIHARKEYLEKVEWSSRLFHSLFPLLHYGNRCDRQCPKRRGGQCLVPRSWCRAEVWCHGL
jgi:hypothetical protein